MQNEVDASAEANTEVMRKMAMVGTVTPASVLAEAIASVTSPRQESYSELNAASRSASCISDKRHDVSSHLSDYRSYSSIGQQDATTMFPTIPVKEAVLHFHALKACRGSWYLAPYILNLGARWRRVDKITYRQLYPRDTLYKRATYTIYFVVLYFHIFVAIAW